jgi:hypothetical protein
VSKETYYSVKRDPLQCQKRPITVSKETYYRDKRQTFNQLRLATRLATNRGRVLLERERGREGGREGGREREREREREMKTNFKQNKKTSRVKFMCMRSHA